MIKKALIFDLDDTIYPTKSVADKMFADLNALIKPHVSEQVYQNIKEDLLTTPFQKVADRYQLNKDLKEQGMKVSLEMIYNDPMTAFEDYDLIKDFKIDKFLVTAGYTKLQKSKIKQLNIEKDFREIFIPDPAKSDLDKKDIFEQIMNKYNYEPKDILVIGDNPESEIAAAKELGIDTYLYDQEEKYSPALADHYGSNYKDVVALLG